MERGGGGPVVVAADGLSGPTWTSRSSFAERRTTMGRRLVPRYLATLDVTDLTDTEAHELVGNINLVAPKAAIMKGNVPLETSLGELLKRDTALTASNQLVADDRQKLR